MVAEPSLPIEIVTMPPRMPMLPAGVVTLTSVFLLIAPPTKRKAPRDAVKARSPWRVLRIVDEAVDGDFAVDADRQRRAVGEHQVRSIVGAGAHALVGEHVDADPQDALVLGRRRAARLAADRRSDADGLRHGRQGEADQEEGNLEQPGHGGLPRTASLRPAGR